AGATVLLSLLHGSVMAWIGLVGVYAVPALVVTPNPSVEGLLGYVGIATAGSTLLLRWRRWIWLGWVALAGAALWSLLALLEGKPGELAWPLGLFLLALPPLFVVLADAVGDDPEARLRQPTAWVATGFAALMMWGLVERLDYSPTALGFALALAALLAALALRHVRFERLAWIGGGLAALLIASWKFAPGAL